MTRVLVRASWQTANIGDVAHAPGCLQALRRADPDAELVLWAVWLDDRELRLIRTLLPDVTIVEGNVDRHGRPGTAALRAEFEAADVLVHGSGPAPLREAEMQAWRRLTGKPYGFFGVTFDPFDPAQDATLDDLGTMIDALPPDYLSPGLRDTLEHAAFVYCRDSHSVGYLRGQGIDATFVPDAVFTADVADAAAAAATLAEFGLDDGRFACVIPSLRWTPYYRLRGLPPDQRSWRRDAVNAAYVERDMKVLRDGIETWVRRTGTPVLLVPEMIQEVELARQYLADGYPADVQPYVHHLPRYWDLSEAAGVYARAAAVFGHECHSPILASTFGVPSLYVRVPNDTVKGRMWADVGLPDSCAEIGPDAAVTWIEELLADPSAARERATTANRVARGLLDDAARQILQLASAGRGPRPAAREPVAS